MLFLFLSYLDDDDDKKYFEIVYYSYRKQMFTMAASILKNELDAEDAVSKVFLHIAQKNWKTVREIHNKVDLRNYLLKAIKNTALNMLKAKKTERAFFDSYTQRKRNTKYISDNDFLDYICDRYDCSKAVDAISNLSEKYRYVLYYHYILNMTVKETAKALNQSENTTKKQITRGKKMLLDLLKEDSVNVNVQS